jgi:hypothetical protein
LLVSVKIIMMNIKNSNSNREILKKLDDLHEKIEKIQNH